MEMEAFIIDTFRLLHPIYETGGSGDGISRKVEGLHSRLSVGVSPPSWSPWQTPQKGHRRERGILQIQRKSPY